MLYNVHLNQHQRKPYEKKKTISEPTSSTVVDNVLSVDTSESDSELPSICDGNGHEESTSESTLDLLDQWDTWLR